MAQVGGQQALGAGSFFGSVESRREHCGAIFTSLRHTSARRLPSHSHELAFFAVLLDGLYGERYGRQQKQFRPFTLHFRPAGAPHQDEVGPRGVRFFEIEIRPEWSRRMADCSSTLDTAYDDCHGGEVLWLAMKVLREVQNAETPDELSVEGLLAELVAAVARGPRIGVEKNPAWLSRILDKVSADYATRLTLDELSCEAGVHPVHLSRVFRTCVGEGIGEYVHRLRVRAACEQMLEPESPLTEISLAAGFSDQSHFTRIFRRITGMTPAFFRSLVTRSTSPAHSSRLKPAA